MSVCIISTVYTTDIISVGPRQFVLILVVVTGCLEIDVIMNMSSFMTFPEYEWVVLQLAAQTSSSDST